VAATRTELDDDDVQAVPRRDCVSPWRSTKLPDALPIRGGAKGGPAGAWPLPRLQHRQEYIYIV
jgi:hypothetical protein